MSKKDRQESNENQSKAESLMDLFADDPNYRSLEEDLMSEVNLWIPTITPVDYAIGGFQPGPRKGIPHGRVVEIYGHESSGKSAFLRKIINNFQKLNGFCLLGDREHAHESERLIQIGVNPKAIKFIEKRKLEKNKTMYSEEKDFTLEEFFERSERAFIKIRKVDMETPILVALDSLAVTPTNMQQEAMMKVDKKGKEKEVEGFSMRTRLDKPGVMSDLFPDFCTNITENNACLVIINQTRENPNISFGRKDYTPGGNTLPFAASIRMSLWKSGEIKPDKEYDPRRKHRGDEPIGLEVSFQIIKNKVGLPLRRGRFPLFFDDREIDDYLAFVWLLQDRKVHEYCEGFDKSGSWYSWKDERIGQGDSNMARFFMENPDVMKEIEYEAFQKESE